MGYHQQEQTIFVETPDLYHRLPDSGEDQYKSRGSNRQFAPTARGGGTIRGGVELAQLDGEVVQLHHIIQI